MLTVREIKPDVWELTLKGVIDRGDVETMARELTPVLEGDRPIGLIVRAEGWTDMTADAMVADARFEFGMLTQWARIAKMAMVTDLQAFAAIMRWIDPILPMIDMRSFGSDDVAGAEAFASDLPARAAHGSGKGVTLLSDGADGVIAFEIDGRITGGDVDRVMAPLAPRLEGDERINLLVRFRAWDGFDPSIMTDGSLLGMKMGAMTRLGRYAVVGAPRWMATIVGGAAALMPFEMRMFDAEDDADAWAWARGA